MGTRTRSFGCSKGSRSRARGSIGPWAHGFPHDGLPGPAIGFLQECVRWWDRWLKGDRQRHRRGADAARLDPGSRPRSGAPRGAPGPLGGRGAVARRRGSFRRGPSRSATARSTETPGRADLAPRARLAALRARLGSLVPVRRRGSDLPPDQRMDDGLSLCFDSSPLESRLEMLGFPEARLALAADRPVAFVAVRLCDVAPTGESTLVSTGVLNLAHRESHEASRASRSRRALRRDGSPERSRPRVSAGASPPPGRVADLLALVWPSSEPVVLSVLTGASVLRLPARELRAGDDEPAPFGEPECSPPLAVESLSEGSTSRTIARDVASGERRADLCLRRRSRPPADRHGDDGGLPRDVSHRRGRSALGPCRDRPHGRARPRGVANARGSRGAQCWSDAAAFYTTNAVEAYEGDEQIFARTRELERPARPRVGAGRTGPAPTEILRDLV